MHGDICYIYVKPHDGDKLYITASTYGFYVNKVKPCLHVRSTSPFFVPFKNGFNAVLWLISIAGLRFGLGLGHGYIYYAGFFH